MVTEYGVTLIDGISRTDIYNIDPRIIDVIPGFNKRVDYSGEEELMRSIIANGVQEPVRVQGTIKGKNPSKRFKLISGHRRLRATMAAIKAGHKIERIPAKVVKDGISQSELLYMTTIANDGKSFTPTEDGETYKQLIAWGGKIKDISERIGKSIVYIQQRIDLVTKCNISIQQAINAAQITMDAALNIASKTKGDVKKQDELLDKYLGISDKKEKKAISDDPEKECKKYLKQLNNIYTFITSNVDGIDSFADLDFESAMNNIKNMIKEE